MQLTLNKNIELWAKVEPTQAIKIANIDDPRLKIVLDAHGEENLHSQNKMDSFFYYDHQGIANETMTWMGSLDIAEVDVLFLFGIGLGHYYRTLIPWLKENPERQLIFLEDNLAVIRRFLETTHATQLLKDSQVQLRFFDPLDKELPLFENLYWNCAMKRIAVSALKYYEKNRSEVYEKICQKITYDFAVKNALVDEYLRYGGPFFINFYQNMLSLPYSFLGNKTFGSFYK